MYYISSYNLNDTYNVMLLLFPVCRYHLSNKSNYFLEGIVNSCRPLFPDEFEVRTIKNFATSYHV